MWRKRVTPACFATASMLAVAWVWRRSKVAPWRRCSRMIPTRWTIAAQPSTDPARASGSSTSPGTRSMASNPRRSASDPGRTRQRTRKLWARRARITDLPTKPVPPVTKIRFIMRRIVARPQPKFFRGCGAWSRYHGRMPRHSMRLALALLCLAVAAPAAALGGALEWTALGEAVRDAVSAGDLPGAVVLVGQDDRVLYRKAFGSRAVTPAVEPMTLETVFDIASLTKVVATTPAVLALWEQGKIDLDAPLGRYLHEFAGPAFRSVTIRRILTHSAGFPDLPSPRAIPNGMPQAVPLLAREPLAYNPGTAFHYSDTGFILLGEMVRRVSGERLDQFARRRFFAPLGMGATAFRPAESWRPRIAPTEALGGTMLRGVVHDGNARLLSGVAGHAGVFSTADDLARFCRMLLDGGTLAGHRYLKEATVVAMFEPRLIGETTRGLGWDMASAYSRALGRSEERRVG